MTVTTKPKPKRNVRIMSYSERYLRYRAGLRATPPSPHNLTPYQAKQYRDRVDEALRAHERKVLSEAADRILAYAANEVS